MNTSTLESRKQEISKYKRFLLKLDGITVDVCMHNWFCKNPPSGRIFLCEGDYRGKENRDGNYYWEPCDEHLRESTRLVPFGAVKEVLTEIEYEGEKDALRSNSPVES